jgi:hypothetical protein
MSLIAQSATIDNMPSWLDALNYFLQCDLFRAVSAVFLLFLARCLCTDLIATINVSRIEALIELMNEILEAIPEERTQEGVAVIELLQIFTRHFSENPHSFPLDLQVQWAIKGLEADDEQLFDVTALFFYEASNYPFMRRFFLLTNAVSASCDRALDCSFTSRIHLVGAVLRLVQDATTSQLTDLIRSGAAAVVTLGLALPELRRDVFATLALLLRNSFCNENNNDVVIEQFTRMGGHALFTTVYEEMDDEPDEVCEAVAEFMAAYDLRDPSGGDEEEQ